MLVFRKKICLVGFLVVISFSNCIYAQSIGLGVSPSDSVSGKVGTRGYFSTPSWIFGIGVIFNSEYGSTDFVDAPIPHSDYSDLGKKRIGATTGVEVSRIFHFFDDESKPEFFLGAGWYWERVSRIVKSNVSGWLWSQDASNQHLFPLSCGITFKPKETSMEFGLEYSSLRGFGVFVGSRTF